MPDIDFLSQDNKDIEDEDSNDQSETLEVEYTKPGSGRDLVARKVGAKRRDSKADLKNKQVRQVHNPHLKRSRRDVLAAIKDEKKGKKKQTWARTVGDQKKKKFTLFGWLGKKDGEDVNKDASGAIFNGSNKEASSGGASGAIDRGNGPGKKENESSPRISSAASANKSRTGWIKQAIQRGKPQNMRGTAKSGSGGWKHRGIIKTNLIKGELTIHFEWLKHSKIILLYIFSSVSVIFIVYGGLLLLERASGGQEKFLLSETKATIAKIKDLEDRIDSANRLKDKIKMAELLLDKHIYWTNFFDFLNKNTLANVYYSEDFSGKTDGQYSMAARADSYHTIADQIKVMSPHEQVLEINVKEGSLVEAGEGDDGESEVEFTLELLLDSDIFLK